VWVKLEMYDPASNSDSDGLGAIAGAEFFHDVLDMSLHRFFRDEKERCDVAVGRRRGGSLRLDSMGAVCSQQLNGKVNCPESGLFVQVIVCVVVRSKSDISGLAFCDPKSIWASRR
jgi:hypothetical protein